MVLRALVFALLYLLTLESVQGVEVHARELGIADIPPCGLTCLVQHIVDSDCDIADVQCQCEDVALSKRVSACMLANCTMEDSLGFARVENDMCHLSEDSKSHEVFIYTCICYPIAVLFVALRLAGKIATKRIRKDDWIVIASIVLAALPIACVLKMTTIGFGEHLWNLKTGELLRSIRYFYIAWSTYVIVLGMMKASLVLFYLEIFPVKQVRTIAYLIMGWIIVNSLVLFFLTTFNCWPVNAFWDRDIKGRCMDINAIAFANSASSIAQDIVLLIFPLACIRQLKMERHRKVAVGLMFSIGTFGCIATILRLQSLLTFKATLDPTWDYVPVTIWTEIELACGYVCVSLPAIRVLLSRIFPKSVISSMSSSQNTNDPMTPQYPYSNPVPKVTPAPVKKRRQSVWMRLSAAAYRDSSDSAAAVAWPAGWSPRPWSGPSPSRARSHQRLGSDQGSECMNLSHVRTCTPSVPEQITRSEQDVEMGVVPEVKSHAQVCLSCRTENEYLTALPTLGCLPDAEYSSINLKDVIKGEWKSYKYPIK